jgi:hypothetical protein
METVVGKIILNQRRTLEGRSDMDKEHPVTRAINLYVDRRLKAVDTTVFPLFNQIERQLEDTTYASAIRSHKL